MTPALSVLVLTEDGSPWAFTTMQALARKMLPFVDRHTATNRVQFEPGKKAVPALRANRWRSRNPRDRPLLVDLRQELATKILEDDVPGYVLFHFDGDRPWSKNTESDTSQAFKKFLKSLYPLVQAALLRRNAPADDAAIETRLCRICPVTPYYSVEAWLYQNIPLVREACERSCGQHLDLINEWEINRASLEEVVKPKEHLCIGSRKNAELAEAFTSELADTLWQLETSFHATIERLEACPGLATALANTWKTPPDVK